MNPQLELSALFEAERGQHLTPQAIDAGWLRLEQALALPAATVGLASAPAKLGLAMLAKSFLATSALLVAANGVGLLDVPPASELPTAPPARAPSASAPLLELPAPLTVTSAVVQARPKPAYVERRAPAVTTAPPDGAADASFDEELRLIGNAKRELDRGQMHLASIWLNEHGSRYPAGAFTSEREGLKILLSCATLNAASRATAERFAARYPASPLLDRIFRSCGVQDESSAESAKRSPAK